MTAPGLYILCSVMHHQLLVQLTGGWQKITAQHDEPCSLPSAGKAGTQCFTVQHPGVLHDRSAVVCGGPHPGACAVNWQSCRDLHALSAFDMLHALSWAVPIGSLTCCWNVVTKACLPVALVAVLWRR